MTDNTRRFNAGFRSALPYWCAAAIFAIQISSRWQGTPVPHAVGVAFCVPLSVPPEFAGAPVTPANTNLPHTPAFESVLSHCQLFEVFAPKVNVRLFSQASANPVSFTVPARVPQAIVCTAPFTQ